MSNKVLQFPIFEQADLSRFCQCLYLSASHQGVDEARAQRLVQGFEGLVQKVGYSLAQPVEIFFISKNQFLLQCTGGETIKSDYFKTTLIDEGVVVEFDVLTFDSDVLNFFSIRSERQQLLQLENLNRQLEAKNQEFKTLLGTRTISPMPSVQKSCLSISSPQVLYLKCFLQ